MMGTPPALPVGRKRVWGLAGSMILPFLPLPLLLLNACGFNRANGPTEETMPTIEEVQERHTPGWMELPQVVGTGIGLCDDQEPCIRVFLSAPWAETEAAIPERVEGYRVEVVITGRFQPRGLDPDGDG